MSDVEAWIKERRKSRQLGTAGPWFWTGSTREVWGRAPGDHVATFDDLGDAAKAVDAQRHFPRTLNALEKVLELHQWRGYIDRHGATVIEDCNECDTDWPCATYEAIEGAING